MITCDNKAKEINIPCNLILGSHMGIPDKATTSPGYLWTIPLSNRGLAVTGLFTSLALFSVNLGYSLSIMENMLIDTFKDFHLTLNLQYF